MPGFTRGDLLKFTLPLALAGGCDVDDADAPTELREVATEQARIILDTDMASDSDDAGALTMLHALADEGKAKILGVMVSTGGPYGAPAVDVINTFHGRPDIPIGTTKDSGFWIGTGYDKTQRPYKYEVFNKYLTQNFPSSLKSGTNAPDAVALYRKLLAESADGSVIITTIGPLINVHGLLESGPDVHSPLDGHDLIAAKVKMLVVTGGNNPAGTSSNFSKENAEDHLGPVIEGWPGRVIFAGNNTSGDINTGFSQSPLAASAHPSRKAYDLFFAANGIASTENHSSDQGGVLLAVEGTGSYFELEDDGLQELDPAAGAGYTRWDLGATSATRDHAYVIRKAGQKAALEARIQQLMLALPGGKPSYRYIEAESAAGQSAFAPFVVASSAAASGGKYVTGATGAGRPIDAPYPDKGIAEYPFTTEKPGAHAIWIRIRGTHTSHDSFYLQLDAQPLEFRNDLPQAAFTWIEWKTADLGAAGSSHTLRVRLREEKTQIDRILVTSDLGFKP